jgi:two-component system alkaline phosphatase synthesis response regulator PhoP
MLNSKEICLLIEDEEAIGEGLKFNFEAEGYQVEWFKDGLLAMKFIENSHQAVSIILLDLMLPELDGFEILERTRLIAEQVPILVLSAKGLENDKVRAFELGADDYVTKPFSLLELIHRVKGLVKRKKWYKASELPAEIGFGDAVFDTRNLCLRHGDGLTTRLSPTEGLLIQVFLENENRVISRVELLQKVWNYEARTETRTLDVFVAKLRKYIEENPAKPQYLLNVRAVGYAYVTDFNLRSQLAGK